MIEEFRDFEAEARSKMMNLQAVDWDHFYNEFEKIKDDPRYNGEPICNFYTE